MLAGKIKIKEVNYIHENERKNLNPANKKRGNTTGTHTQTHMPLPKITTNRINNHFSFIYINTIGLNFLIKRTKINSIHTGNTLQHQG